MNSDDKRNAIHDLLWQRGPLTTEEIYGDLGKDTANVFKMEKQLKSTLKDSDKKFRPYFYELPSVIDGVDSKRWHIARVDRSYYEYSGEKLKQIARRTA